MKSFMRAAAAATILALATTGASAAVFSGTVSTFGDTTGSGPWDLTSGPITYSGLAITATSPLTFGQLTDLNAVFQDITGGAYGGSPRFEITFAAGPGPGPLNILLGTAALGFGDPNPALFTAAWSGTNVIGNNDIGRYDLSHYGGSPYTDYATALALLGGFTIQEIDFVVDGGWGPNGPQDLNLCNINVAGTSFGGSCSTREVDDVSTLPVMAAGLGLGFFLLRRKRKQPSKA